MSTKVFYEEQLKEIVSENQQVMSWLSDARRLELSEWCVGAGLVRNLVWDTLQGNCFQAPEDIDLIYYELQTYKNNRQAELNKEIARISPAIKWDVTNQATVHLWYCDDMSQSYPPFKNILEGIATWPEYCTAVAISLDSSDQLSILAPYGLEDLFNFKVRWNPKRASYNTFLERARKKFSTSRWPQLRINGS